MTPFSEKGVNEIARIFGNSYSPQPSLENKRIRFLKVATGRKVCWIPIKILLRIRSRAERETLGAASDQSAKSTPLRERHRRQRERAADPCARLGDFGHG
jgi:hypothetical protein